MIGDYILTGEPPELPTELLPVTITPAVDLRAIARTDSVEKLKNILVRHLNHMLYTEQIVGNTNILWDIDREWNTFYWHRREICEQVKSLIIEELETSGYSVNIIRSKRDDGSSCDKIGISWDITPEEPIITSPLPTIKFPQNPSDQDGIPYIYGTGQMSVTAPAASEQAGAGYEFNGKIMLP